MQPELPHIDMVELSSMGFVHNQTFGQSFAFGVSFHPIDTSTFRPQIARLLRDARRLTPDEAEALLIERLGRAVTKAAATESLWRRQSALRDLEILAKDGAPLLNRPTVRVAIEAALAGVLPAAPARPTVVTPPSAALAALKAQMADISTKIAALEGMPQ